MWVRPHWNVGFGSRKVRGLDQMRNCAEGVWECSTRRKSQEDREVLDVCLQFSKGHLGQRKQTATGRQISVQYEEELFTN